MENHTQHHTEQHSLSYKTLILVWLILIFFTGVTVWITNLELGALSVGVALLVATVKVGLVLVYFMHLKFESKMLNILVAFVFIVLFVFIGLTISDYFYR